MKNLMLIAIAVLMIACTKKKEEDQIVNYLEGTRWVMLNHRDSFEFTKDSLYTYQDMTDVGKGVGLRAYGYKFIETNKIDLEEHYFKYHDTIQDNTSQNQFYPYIYFIRLEGSDLYQSLNDDAYLLWGSRLN